MPKRSNQKLKLLYMYKILVELSDEKCGLTLSQIADELQKYGIYAERKTLYDDIEMLKLFGLDVRVRRDKHVRYYLGKRDFLTYELKLMGDMVKGASTLSSREKDELIKKLCNVGGKQICGFFGESDNRNEFDNEFSEMGRNAELICRAMTLNRRIRCRSFVWNSRKQRIMQFEGAEITVSPWFIEFYPTAVLVAFEDKSKSFLKLNPKQLIDVELADGAREGEKEFSALRANGGLDVILKRNAPVVVRMCCSSSIADEVIGKFGTDITVFSNAANGDFEFSVKTVADDSLFAWVLSKEGKAKLLAPDEAVTKFERMLSSFNVANSDLKR